MSAITRRLSIPELSQQILDMARVGVYRESIFEALQPMATKKNIRAAIAHAKRFGLHSVASLRDADLGTYYQVDLVKYQSSQHLIDSPAHFGEDEDLVRRVTHATTTVEKLVAIARGLTVALTLTGIVSLIVGNSQLSFGLLSGAVSAALIWSLQRGVGKRLVGDQ